MRCRSMAFFFSFEKIMCAKTRITISFILCSIYLSKVRFNSLKHYKAIAEENSTFYFIFFSEYNRNSACFVKFKRLKIGKKDFLITPEI